MKIRNVVLLLTILITFSLIAACGGEQENNEPTPPPSKANNPPADNKVNEPPEENNDAPAEQEPEPVEQPPEEQEPEPKQPETPELTHYMNKNYILKPIHPEGESKVVLLTFDDGPKEAEMIDAMLETLEKHEAKAIFFLNGYRIEANPDLLVKLHEHGQIIGNHAWDHIQLPKETEATIDKQITDVQTIVEQHTGLRPKFFRPPHGAGNEYIRAKVKQEGMLYMTWSNGSEDWVKKYQTPEGVIGRVMEQLHPGSNILMHELPWTVEALDTLLTKLKDEGYSILDPRAIQLDYTEPTAG